MEEVVLRGLAKDREDRFPDVAAFTAALVEAVGEPVDETPAAWIPADPDLTRAAASTEATGVASDQPPPASRGRRHRRWPWVAAAVLALTTGTGAGWALERNGTSERTLEDSTGTIFVTVPESWTGQVDPEQWVPFEGRAEQASLAAGTHSGWNSDDDPGEGVFVGVLPGDRLPSRVPGHPECSVQRGPYFDEKDGRRHHDGLLQRVPRRRPHRRARDPGQPEPAALDPDPRRRPDDRQPGARLRAGRPEF